MFKYLYFYLAVIFFSQTSCQNKELNDNHEECIVKSKKIDLIFQKQVSVTVLSSVAVSLSDLLVYLLGT